jgi:anti-sigma B factor antagonist
MSSEPLQITVSSGAADGTRIIQLSGPLVLANLFAFQAKVREDNSAVLILDFTAVPLIDSAGIGALVGAYVNRQKDTRRLALVGVNKRVHDALEVTRVESLFKFYNSIPEAEQGRA